MLYVSHSAEEVDALSDRVIVLDRGQVIRCGSPKELFTKRTDSVLELQ